MSNLIKTMDIPEDVRKGFSQYTSIEIYDDKVVGKGSKIGDVSWFYKDYMTVKVIPAAFLTNNQFAFVIFITHENASNYFLQTKLKGLADANAIGFCSGLYSYRKANEFAQNLAKSILSVMEKFKENEGAFSTGQNAVNQNLSTADEIKKFKELLDMGIISQEEFEAKKKQLLGL